MAVQKSGRWSLHFVLANPAAKIQGHTMRSVVVVILGLLLLAPEVRTQEQPSVDQVRQKAKLHFDRARALERSKEMYKFTSEEFGSLLGDYEAGLEILVSEAEAHPDTDDARKLVSQAAGPLREYANHALRKYRYDWVFDYWDRMRKIKKDIPIEAEFASAMALQAHGAFAEGKYDEAIRIFSDMAQISREGSYGKLVMASYHPEFYEKIVRRAKVLETMQVKPEYTAKVFSLRVGLLRFKWKENGLNGEPPTEVSSSPLKLRKGDVELADMAEESLRRTVLAMSDGKLDLVFDRLALIPPLDVVLPDGQKLPNGITQSPSTSGDDIIDRAAGEVGDLLRERTKAADVVILFWWGTSPLTQHGGSRSFKTGSGKSWRGNINIGVQFYHYDPGLDYMNCGACPGPNGIGFYPHVYMHEFFHVVESRFGIQPVHGFTMPQKFPAWKGSDEVDYYWWQIGQNIPSLKKPGRRGNWSDFSFRER
ncbi:MAG TPA: hypothetical protein PKK45_14325 [Leptospiraceae bacterium]|nr:hypothetical protein [Leptospiraceae bacterium]HNN59991.1 hypothetical protein [Leptospiraceae bacterium]